MPDDTRDEDEPLSAAESLEADSMYAWIESEARSGVAHLDVLVRTGRNREARAQLARLRMALQHLRRTGDRWGQEDLVLEVVANVGRRIASGEDVESVVNDELAFMAEIDGRLAALFASGAGTVERALDRRAKLVAAGEAHARGRRATAAAFDLLCALGMGGKAIDHDNWQKVRREHKPRL